MFSLSQATISDDPRSSDKRDSRHADEPELTGDEESARIKIQWQEIGQVDNNMIAGLAKEMLESEGIPVVVMSQAGFLGDLGLPLHNVFTGDPIRTRLLVPQEAAEEATSLMYETMGEMWYPVPTTNDAKLDQEDRA